MNKYLENIILIASDDIQDFVDDNRDDLNWDDINWDGKPKGRQQVAMINHDITLTHMPTGKSATANEFRSQHLNRSLAILKLIIKLNEYK